MNSIIHITTKKKDNSSVPIVVLKRYYFATGEESHNFNWIGILYPIQKIGNSLVNFINNWGNSLQKVTPKQETDVSREIMILNTETGNFDKVEVMPENISILIQENINIREN